VTVIVALWVALVAGGAWRWRPPPRRAATARALAHHNIVPAATATAVTDGRGPRPSRFAAVSLVGAGIVLALLWPPLGLLAGGTALTVPRLLRRRNQQRRRRAIQRQLPDVVDLFVVAISAGLTPALAVDRLTALAPEPFAAAFAETGRRVSRGQRLADALDALPALLGDAARPLAHTLASAERYGSPLGPALELLAHDARRDRRRLAEEAARTVPVKLCFPLVCCTLPAFVLLTIAPLVAGALRSLRL
jgi:tight adherence protein C